MTLELKNNIEKMFKEKKLPSENIEFRKKQIDIFLNKGFPNKKIEEWKYSDLDHIIKQNISNLNFELKLTGDFNYNNSEILNDFEHNKIIYVNGKIKNFDFPFEERENIEINYNQDFKTSKNSINSLINLNNALTFNYSKIRILKNYNFKKPLVIYHFGTKDINSSVINFRSDFVLEENSSLCVINIFKNHSKNNFININQQYKISKNANLKNYRIDSELNSNINYFFTNIDLENNSNSETFIYSAGSKFFRNEINCNLNDKYSSAFISGIINLNESQHHEIKTNINHLSENTKSYQLIKSVLNDSSKGVFQGKIFVDHKAQKTDGYQLSKSLLLDKDAEFDAKPELEIYADDVKCSHGSTSGNLDENSIFYLMSRGLSYKQSKKLLVDGFLNDAIEKITNQDVKKYIKKLMKI
jgi:Fe-S cluster assembly protein SufD